VTPRRSVARSERGQSTVELALVLPALLLLLIGILDVALAVNADITITNASREAASFAIAHPTAAPADIASAASARIGPLHSVTVAASYHDGTTFVDWPANGVPSNSAAPRQIPVRVDVTYPWSASTILIGQFFGGTRTFNASSTMWLTW
jgi:Flp pilus assembly protein TadG